MSSVVLIVLAVICFIAGYTFYGRFIAKRLAIDPSRKTPAHTMRDNVDYVPAKVPVLLGHHFASIAGAAPIIGPITAAVFGWIPVFLWIVLGSIFIGAVHDFTSLIASVRHKGQSIGKVIEEQIGQRGKQLFLIFAWSALILVIAAFTILVAKTFSSTPAVGTSSSLFILLAILFGLSIYRMNAPLAVATIVGIVLLLTCIWLGIRLPIVFSNVESQGQYIWTWILLVYIFVASVTPVWILLQPRDYLNSFLLYMVLFGAFLGILFKNPTVELPAFTAFVDPKLGSLFPILFVTVACGAISGFHSLVASGTTAKQLNREPDARPVGYGGMLTEGLLAVIALITAITLLPTKYQEFFPAGGRANPIGLFASGVGSFVTKLAVPMDVGVTFAALAVSAFALTSLDTATRLGRFAFQEFFRSENPTPIQNFLTNRFVATFFTVLAGGILALSGSYQAIWPIFGSANQLLAALALLAGSVWLAKKKQKNEFLRYPMYFMFAVTLSALVILAYKKIHLIVDYYAQKEMPATFDLLSTYILATVSILLFVVAIIVVKEAYQKLRISDIKQ
ncbi:MAG: carbon starvation protein A [bacterium]|nr:MAG: carbon starvation protein A [bacterium]